MMRDRNKGLLKCPVCGEMYSKSYTECPFCEENAEVEKKKPPRRITDMRKAISARGGLIAVLVLVLALMGWYLFGDSMIRKGVNPAPDDNTSDTTQAAPFNNFEQSVVSETSSSSEPAPASEPDDRPDPSADTESESQGDASTDVSDARLNRDDFTLSYAGEEFTIKLSGTTATPTWSIDNANVARIGTDGTVTAVADGDTTVHCSVGTRDLVCIVRVRNTGRSAEAAIAPTTAETVAPVAPVQPNLSPSIPEESGHSSIGVHVDTASLGVRTNNEYVLPLEPEAKQRGERLFDCTIPVSGEPTSLIITGTNVQPSGWMTDNASVLKVDRSGNLTPVSTGAAHITAFVGDAKVKCIIRVR